MNENAIDRKLVSAFIDGLISDDGEREKGLEYIRNMPPVTQKSGKWLKMPIGFKCSNCNELEDRTTKYCPNCGAKMESENRK